MKQHDLQELQRFIDLRAEGKSYEAIAREMNRAKQTLIDWGHDLKEDINNGRNIKREAMMERLRMGEEARLESLGLVLDKLRAEIDKRSFADLSTDKLLDAYAKYSRHLSEAAAEPTFVDTGKMLMLKRFK